MDTRTTTCEKCNKQIIALNIMLHQLKCPGTQKALNTSKTTKSKLFSTQKIEDKSIYNKKCPICLQMFNQIIFPIHQIRCSGQIQIKKIQKQEKPTQEQQVLPPKQSLKKHKIKMLSATSFPNENALNNCIRCGESVRISEIQKHTEQCIAFDIKCQFCNQEYPGIVFQQHTNVCEARLQLLKIQKDIQNLNYSDNQGENQNYELEKQKHEYSFESYGEEEHLDSPRGMRQSMMHLYQRMIHNHQIDEREGLDKNQIRKLPRVRFASNQGETQQCNICFVQFSQKQMINKLNCRHLYHPQCLQIWLQLNSLCPVCKIDVRNKPEEEWQSL